MRQRRHCKRFFDHKYIIKLFLLKTASLQLFSALLWLWLWLFSALLFCSGFALLSARLGSFRLLLCCTTQYDIFETGVGLLSHWYTVQYGTSYLHFLTFCELAPTRSNLILWNLLQITGTYCTVLLRVDGFCRWGARLDPRAGLQEGVGSQPHQQRAGHTGRVADPDPDSIGSVDPDPGGQKWPTKVENFCLTVHVLTCWMASWEQKASSVTWTYRTLWRPRDR